MWLLSLGENPYEIIINQSPHGKYQAYKAMDFGHLRGNAPATGKVIYNRPQSNKQQNYFSFGQDDWAIQAVHSNPAKPVGTVIPVGGSLWATTWHHIHAALDFKSQWRYYLGSINWSLVRVYWLKVGQYHPVWTKEGTYTKLELPPFNTNSMVKVITTSLQKLTTTNTAPLKIRLEPIVKQDDSNLIGTIGKEGGYVWEGNMYALGTVVDGENKWWTIPVPQGQANAGVLGYISAKFVKAEPVDVAALQAQVKTLQVENQGLQTTVTQYKPGYDAAKLIQTVK